MQKYFFKPNHLLIYLLVFMLNPASLVLSIENGNDSDALFKRGTVYFRQGKFVSSALDFREAIDIGNKKDPVVPSSYIMLAKSYFMLNDLTHAESAAKELQSEYPGSYFDQWADYLIGACRFKNGQINEAASLLSKLAAKTKDDVLRDRSLSALKYAILPKANKDEFQRIISENGLKIEDIDASPKPEIEFAIDEIIDPQVEISKEMSKWEDSEEIKIGLLSPLTGSNTELGEALRQGVIAAYEQTKEVNGKKVNLIIEDVESDPVKSVMKTRKLIDAGVMAIIGPVQSETTVPAAIEAEYNNIPLIAPTATNAGLTDIGEFVFQLNSNPSVQAEALARFAVETLGCRNFAVIAHGDSWGRTAARAFSDVIKSSGAGKTSVVFTNPDDPEFNQKTIYDLAGKFPLPESSDSLSSESDSLEIQASRATLVSENCIFVSAITSEAIQLVSLLRENGLDAHILGDSGWWNDERLLTKNLIYLEGSYIISSAGVMSGGIGKSYFRNRPFNESEAIPLMKGADAYNIIIEGIKKGGSNPSALAEAISNLKNFRGVSTFYTMDPETRSNSRFGIVRVIEGDYIDITRTK